MGPRIRGSDVYVVEDIERILAALAGASRRYSGEYGSGYGDALRDVARAVGGRVDDMHQVDVVHEVVEYRHERTQWSMVNGQRSTVEPYQTQPALALTDCEFCDFVPGSGEVRRMESGWMWLGNDGTKTFYPVQQWVEIPAADARRLGYLIADNRTFVLAVRSLAEARMRQMQGSVRVLPTERRLLR